jgi:hypothetical protein
MLVKMALRDISFLPSPQTKFLTKQKKKMEYYNVVFKREVGGINNYFDPEH